jgi:hypothetical protein
MAESPSSVLEELTAIFPAFANAWGGSDNHSLLDDGFFTHHGLFIEFTAYYREHYGAASSVQIAKLAEKINVWFDGPNADLDNAVATCFLENIAGEASARRLKPLLKEKAVEFVRYWEPAT